MYSWLREFYPALPKLGDIERRLIWLGHDVENIERLLYLGLVVGEIRRLEPHPNADRLVLLDVFDGQTSHSIVCGDTSVSVGQKVIYAPPGTSLPCGVTIKKALVRGVSSDGMACAADELGIAPARGSLYPLPPEAAIGKPVAAYLPEDGVISLDITPNRGDVLSHFGLARDLLALVERRRLVAKFSRVDYATDPQSPLTISDLHRDAPILSLGSATYASENAVTSAFVASRLNLAGSKTINLPTDIANYLMLAYGLPIHAYDRSKLSVEPQFAIRRAKDGETVRGLNDTDYTLTPQALVVTDGDRAVAIAGIMGDDTTKTSRHTQEVVFECAYFQPKAIDIAARGLNLLTESAARFSRGVDWVLADDIVREAQAMIQSLAGATVFPPVKKVVLCPQTPVVEAEVATIGKILGRSITQEEMTHLLTAVGVAVTTTARGVLKLQSPSWRYDLNLPIDYAEETARMIGLEEWQKKPLTATVPQWKRSKYWRQEQLKDVLVNLGALEIATYPFVNRQEVALFGLNQNYRLVSTVFDTESWLRSSLLPGMCRALGDNPETPSLFLFEIAKVFGPLEVPKVAIIASGPNETELDDWWKHLFERLNLPVSSWMSRAQPLRQDVLAYYKIRKPFATTLQVGLDELLTAKSGTVSATIPDLDSVVYTPLSKYQTSRRDIALVVSRQTNPVEIAEAIGKLTSTIVGVELFDQYTDKEKLGANRQSLAYRIVYQAADHTLTAEEIQACHRQVEEFVQNNFGATLR